MVGPFDQECALGGEPAVRARRSSTLLPKTLTRSLGYWYDVIYTLVGRELRVRYKGSTLGLLWAVLNPLGMVLILHLLFARVLPLKIPHYAAFVYCGLLPWNWFQSAIQIGSAALIDNRDLVRKPFFPRPLLPAVVVTSNFLLYLMAFPVLLLLLLIEGLPLSPALLLLPVVWLAQAAFTLACTILIAAVSVLVRDVQYMLGMVMLLWFYLTPIFYDLERIGADHARWLMLNPLTTMVQAHRDILLSGHAPDWLALGLNALLGSVLLAASLAVFRWLEDAFVEEV